MRLASLTLEQYRNFEKTDFAFKEKTALIGPNGSGKSNIIESIRLLSVGKSFKTNRLDDVIRFKQAFFRISATRTNQEKQELEFFYGQPFSTSPTKERRLRVDNQEESWGEFWGKFPSVLFIPNDIEIVIGAPQLRRRYMDSIIWQIDKEFRHDHLELGRVLRERSTLLFLLKINRAGRDELQPWNELLNQLTDRIRAKRKALIEFISSYVQTKTNPLFSPIKISIEYQPNTVDPDESYADEVRLGQNLVGPHRDELEILFNDSPARRFTSRGQARSIVVLLKAAEAAYIEQISKNRPLVLLDDMFSELDRPTAEKLFTLFGDHYPLIASSIEANPIIGDWHTIVLGKA